MAGGLNNTHAQGKGTPRNMDELDLRQTPTLQLSGQNAAENITLKLKAELERVEQDEHVIAARAAFAEAETVFDRTRLAMRRINDRVGELTQFLGDVAIKYVDELIESAAAGGKRPDSKISTQIINSENEHRLSVRAIGRIAEHLIPKAEIAKLRAVADVERVRAYVMDRLANERGQRLMDAMGPAVAEEVSVQVDMKGGVAGMLLGLANQARLKANGHETEAKELQEKYDEQQRQTRKGF
jgi:hypothetical protein